MPTDEMVEKVALAIAREAVDDLDMFRGVNGDAAFDALMALSRRQARAALEAAEAGASLQKMQRTQTEPVAWMWEEVVDPTGEVIHGKTIQRVAFHWSTPPTNVKVTPLYASPPSEASREERAVFPIIERELVACLEADGIECEQDGHAWTADVSRRTELDVTGIASAIATAIRARGETERQRDPILPLRPCEAMLMQERYEGGDCAIQVDTTTERLVQKVETPDGETVFEMGRLSEEKS